MGGREWEAGARETRTNASVKLNMAVELLVMIVRRGEELMKSRWGEKASKGRAGTCR